MDAHRAAHDHQAGDRSALRKVVTAVETDHVDVLAPLPERLGDQTGALICHVLEDGPPFPPDH